MQLLIVRHAIAAERDASAYESDGERPLTPKGARRMRVATRGIARLLSAPDAIYTSPLVRARETAVILAGAWSSAPAPATLEVLSPGHPPAEVGQWLKTLPDGGMLGLVGHEPGCSELLAFLTGGPAGAVDFKKGGAALVELSRDRGRPRHGLLIWLATPRLLRLAGR